MKMSRVLAMVVAVCIALALSSLAGAAPQRTLTVVVLMPNGGDPYFQNKSYGYIVGKTFAEMKHSGIRVNVELFDAGGYENSARQITQMENAIQRRVSAIVLTATNAAALIPVAKRALAARIPVINDDVLITSDDATMKISENSANVGRMLADFLVRRLEGRGNVVMLKGPAGAELFVQRAKGAKDEFARYSNVNVIGEQWHPSNIVEATRVMENFVQAHGDRINAVWSGNTTQACAAGRVLRQAGRSAARILTVGADLHAEAIRCLNDGLLSGILPAQPVKLARLAVVYAVDAALGQAVPKRIYTTDELVLTRETIGTFDTSDAMAPAGWKPPLR